EEPFVQVIVDLAVPSMAYGRVCLIGDAAFAARPHAAAGTAKTAENAWALADALARERDVARALAAWEPGQLELGRRLVDRSRRIGERYQVSSTADPRDEELRFGLYGPGRERSPRGPATAHIQHVPGDQPRSRRGEEDDGAGHLFDLADAAD